MLSSLKAHSHPSSQKCYHKTLSTTGRKTNKYTISNVTYNITNKHKTTSLLMSAKPSLLIKKISERIKSIRGRLQISITSKIIIKPNQ